MAVRRADDQHDHHRNLQGDDGPANEQEAAVARGGGRRRPHDGHEVPPKHEPRRTHAADDRGEGYEPDREYEDGGNDRDLVGTRYDRRHQAADERL